MSIYCLSWVFQNARTRLGDRLVHLALADYAHDDGTNAWPSYEALGEKAQLSRRQAMRACAKLQEAGQIRRQGVTESGTVKWQVLMDEASIEQARQEWAETRGGDNLSPPAEQGGTSDGGVTNPQAGVTNPTIPVSDLSPKPLVEPSVQQPSVQQLRHSPKNDNGNSRIDGEGQEAAVAPGPKLPVGRLAFEVQRVFDHWVRVTQPKLTNLSPSRERVIAKAVKEMGADLCIQAVDGLVAYQRNRGGNLQLSRCLATNMKSGPLGERIEFWASQAPQVNADGGLTQPTIPVGLSAMFASRVSGQLEELRIADKSTSWAAIQRGKDAEEWFASKGFQVGRRPDGSPYIEAIDEEVGA